MAVLTVQTLTLAGVQLTGNSAAAGGDSFANDGRTYFKMTNGDASPHTPTFDATQTVTSAALAVADLANATANGEEKIYGPFPVATFGSSVSVSYDAVTSVVVDVFKLEN
jgi:hypothetical protein